MRAPLIPAKLSHTDDGTPYSERYGDVYHSAGGGTEQARHVFIHGNGLPGRWRGLDRFVILETGFGLGLNFLATWQAWREDAERCKRLHFVSLEKHPLARDDLKAVHRRYAPLAPLAAQLQAQWPLPLPGMQRLFFEGERVILTLAFADVGDALAQLRLAADALYLDGFSPVRNPEMWSREVVRGLARLCAPGATAATWSVARALREALADAGFEVEKRAGFARKRDMTVARLREGAARTRKTAVSRRKAIVIGAGIAGSSVCERLCARGWEVTLIERNLAPAQEASGNLAAVFHPIATRDDSHLARLTRAGYFAALALWERLDAAGHAPRRSHCGVLQLARNEDEARAQQEALANLALPASFARYVSQADASSIAGAEVAASGIWFPEAGWIDPRSLANALLTACGARLVRRFGTDAAAIERRQGNWRVLDTADAEIAHAPVLVLANAADALRLAPSRFTRLRRVRGQLTYVRADKFPALHAAVLRGGFVLPPIDGRVLVGASFDLEDNESELRADSHEGNLERMKAILPRDADWASASDAAQLDGRVGFRAVAPDRLPIVGEVPDEESLAPSDATLSRLPRAPGLYGAFAYASRGTIWSALAGELLASQIETDPLALEGPLADALDPGRFAVRALRRNRKAWEGRTTR